MSDKLHTVNNDVNQLDDLIALLVGKNAVPQVDLAAWKQTAIEWRDLFSQEVDRSVLGALTVGISDSELDQWSKRIDQWRAKAVGWDSASKLTKPIPAVAPIVESHLPEASNQVRARIETRKEEEKQKLPKADWEKFVWLGGGILGFAALGYVLSGVARLSGK